MANIVAGSGTRVQLAREATFKSAAGLGDVHNVTVLQGFSLVDGGSRETEPSLDIDVLEEKTTCADEAWTGTAPVPFDVNQLGVWLSLLLGDPDADGPIHQWTPKLQAPESAHLAVGFSNGEWRRWLGVYAKSISMGFKQGDGQVSVELLPATLEPQPFINAPLQPVAQAITYDHDRSCKQFGQVEDIENGNTLGHIVSSSLTVERDLDPISLADGQAGYGLVDAGFYRISGEMQLFFEPGSAMEGYILNHTSRPLRLVQQTRTGHRFVLELPAVEFDKPKYEVQTSRGLQMAVGWRAHNVAGQVPVFKLANNVAAYDWEAA